MLEIFLYLIQINLVFNSPFCETSVHEKNVQQNSCFCFLFVLYFFALQFLCLFQLYKVFIRKSILWQRNVPEPNNFPVNILASKHGKYRVPLKVKIKRNN